MPKARMTIGLDGEIRYEIDGKPCSERHWRKFRIGEPPNYEKGECARFNDRDGRWMLANHGRGVECPTLSDDPRRKVYAESRGDMERMAAAAGQEVRPVEELGDKGHARNHKYRDATRIEDDVIHG